MADLVTGTPILKGGAADVTELVQFGEAVDLAQPVYLHTDRKWYLCDANNGQAKAACKAITLCKAATDDRGLVLKDGLVDLGVALTAAGLYIVSANAGKIAPAADLASASWHTVLGGARSTSVLMFRPLVLGVQKP